ncbi:hypothetical protein BJX63DRAFT_25436 [Aspergillus granulosus]|uniref:Uncharacterized protein n=1 Tax=Aspergillus granulosus TaxID=176169 RepID=A0ABR4GZF1_9EURO
MESQVYAVIININPTASILNRVGSSVERRQHRDVASTHHPSTLPICRLTCSSANNLGKPGVCLLPRNQLFCQCAYFERGCKRHRITTAAIQEPAHHFYNCHGTTLTWNELRFHPLSGIVEDSVWIRFNLVSTLDILCPCWPVGCTRPVDPGGSALMSAIRILDLQFRVGMILSDGVQEALMLVEGGYVECGSCARKLWVFL